MVFQDYALYPHKTVCENMAFGLRLREAPQAEIDERASATAAEILQIEHLLDRKPRELSGGQRQRVAMGRAIVRQPKAFLFDEPLSNLDALLRAEMRVEIKKLHQRLGNTIIYVTHDQVEAMTLADRIVVLQAGNLIQIRHAGRHLQPARREVRRGLHRLAADEFPAVPRRRRRRMLHLPGGVDLAVSAGSASPECVRHVGPRADLWSTPRARRRVAPPAEHRRRGCARSMLVEPLGSDTLGARAARRRRDAGEIDGSLPARGRLSSRGRDLYRSRSTMRFICSIRDDRSSRCRGGRIGRLRGRRALVDRLVTMEERMKKPLMYGCSAPVMVAIALRRR